MSLLRAALRWIGKHQLGTLLSLFTVAFGVLCFVAVAEEVHEGDTNQIDRALLLALRSPNDPRDPLGGRGVEEIGRDVTALGGVTVLTLLTLGVLGYLLLIRKPLAALFVAVSVLGALALSSGLKDLFERPRPDLVTRLSYVVTSSFPSGHSMLSASVYLTLGALLARMQANLVVKAYLLLWAGFLAVIVGFSRVYVGVHWPTDVLAGWSAGAAWAAACWLVAGVLQRRGRVEPPSH
jgi:undecaprenyl-diphosphatase